MKTLYEHYTDKIEALVQDLRHQDRTSPEAKQTRTAISRLLVDRGKLTIGQAKRLVTDHR